VGSKFIPTDLCVPGSAGGGRRQGPAAPFSLSRQSRCRGRVERFALGEGTQNLIVRNIERDRRAAGEMIEQLRLVGRMPMYHELRWYRCVTRR
jgi:hypothetical protein